MARKKKAPTKEKSNSKNEPKLKKKKIETGDDDDQHSSDPKNQTRIIPQFSNDVLMVIGTFVETIDIVKSMARVCRDWNQAVVSDGVFSEIFQRDFGNVQWFVDMMNYNLSVDMMNSYQIKTESSDDDSGDETMPKMVKEAHEDSDENCDDMNGDKLTLSEIKNMLESCFGKGKFWYSLYRLVIAFVPIQCPKLITEKEIVVPLKKTNKKTSVTKKDDQFHRDAIYRLPTDEEDEDSFGEEKKVSSNYFYFTLGLREMLDRLEEHEAAKNLIPSLGYGLKTHKLGVILSLFDRHGLILEYFGKNSSHKACLNKITKEYKDHQKSILKYDYSEETREGVGALPRTPYIDTLSSFLIGYDKEENHPCSILQFCYAILCGKEKELFKGNRRDSVKKSTFEDNYDSGNEIGVGPNTEQAFMPYCSYEIIETPRHDEYSYGVSKTAISIDGKGQTCTFISSFPGWVRGFWNANFYWYHVVEFLTTVRSHQDSDMLLIAQNQQQILHNLC